MRLYIAYRYSANNTIETLQNIGKAVRVGHEVAQIKGIYPFIPHLDCMVAMHEPALPLEYYYNCSMEYLKVCDAILIVDSKDIENSKGVKAEFDYCIDNKIPIFISIENLVRNIPFFPFE